MGLFTKKYHTSADRLAAAKELLGKNKGKKVMDLYDGMDEEGLSPEEKHLLAQANMEYWYSHTKETFLNTFLRLNEKAAEAEYLPSMLALAKYYSPKSEQSMKKGERLDPERIKKAVHWYEMALATGCEDADVQEKYDEVAKRLEKDMDENPFSYFNLEEACQRIADSAKRKAAECEQILQEAESLMDAGDKEKASKLYSKIVNMGGEDVPGLLKPMVGKAAYRLMKMASDESVESVKIYQEVFYANRASRTGMPEGNLAQGDLARIRHGKSGVGWYKRAAQAGAREAYFWYGLCCYYGIGTDVDYAQAMEYLSKVCAEEPRAAYLCGVMYAKGLGVPANHAMTNGFYDMAAKKGWNKAYNNKFESVMKANNAQISLFETADKELEGKTHYVTKDGKRVVWSVYGYTYPVIDRD